MVHQGLRHPERAREWYDKAIAWTEEHDPGSTGIRSFGAEAAAFLDAGVQGG